jgi:hypothetical protein
MKRRQLVLAAAIAGALAVPASAHATTQGFSGSCQISGPIVPGRPITLIPVPEAHFSFSGSGTCSGGLPITVTLNNVGTLFDTCELGPDFGLQGLARIGSQNLNITINLARIAVAGPFLLTTPGGGLALGIAQFATTNPTDCISPGVRTATLTANFQTLTRLT